MPFCDLARQLADVDDEIYAAARRVLHSGQYILGAEVDAFEREMAHFLQVRETVAVASGTDALLLSLQALGIGTGAKVLTTPFTFVATASAIVASGAEPVFVDIDPATFDLDPRAVVAMIEGASPVHSRLAVDPANIMAMIPVHLFGQPAEMTSLLSCADQLGVFVVEDCAQALGSTYEGSRAGALGTAGCFSFFPTKTLGAFGDGGLVTSRRHDLVDRLRMLRVHGSSRRHYHEITGHNSRLDELQAAFLRVKLPLLDGWNEERRQIATRYEDMLSGIPHLTLPYSAPGREHTYAQYTVRVTRHRRDALRQHLWRNGVATSIYYPLPLHLQPALGHLGYRPGDMPEAERASQEVLSLPMFPGLRDDEVTYVGSCVQEFAERC